MGLREMAVEDRPRERMLREGAGCVRDDELLAIVLGTGRGSGEDVLELAERLLRDSGGLGPLAGADLASLRGLGGVGPVKATRIAAAFELGRRAGSGARAAREPSEAPGQVASPRPEALAELPEWQRVAEGLRGRVAIGERALLAFRDGCEPATTTLALGEALGTGTRAGAVMARLLGLPGEGSLWVAGVRPGGPPQAKERDAAERVMAAARLVDLPVAGVVLVAGRHAWPLAVAGVEGGAS